ncbi:DHHC palmitoyltransferase-domain-containing protein, partial [Tribonema minus]
MPLEPLQVFTWSLLLVMIVEFYAIVVPGLERGPAIGLGCLYGVFAVGCTIMGFMACKVDPMDHNVGAHAGAGSSTQERTFCFLCQVHVNKGSRHCRYCDKCVARFDHHCRWLNNCIGGTNYRYFVMLLVSTLGLTGLQLALSIWLIVLFHTQSEGDPLYQRIDDRYGSLSSDGYIIIVYVFAVMVLPFVGLLIQLIGFHMMLAREGLTTYDYIIREQKREREKREKRARKEAGAQAAREARSSTHGRSSVTNDEGRDAPLAATAGRQQTRPRSMV